MHQNEEISHSSLLSSALSVSFYKQIVVQSMVCISDLRGSLARALTSGRTIKRFICGCSLPCKGGSVRHPPQRFVWMMEGIKLRKLWQKLLSQKKKNWYRQLSPTHATTAGAFKSTTSESACMTLFIPGLCKQSVSLKSPQKHFG